MMNARPRRSVRMTQAAGKEAVRGLGAGLGESEPARLFEPFFATKGTNLRMGHCSREFRLLCQRDSHRWSWFSRGTKPAGFVVAERPQKDSANK
jgi:hypothetical protein